MRGFRTGGAALMALALAAGFSGSAQASGGYETRAAFIFQMDRALGIRPVYPARSNFTDVSTSNPYYGYIEAAYQLGITNGIVRGVFGPTLHITRAEAAKYLVIAFGAKEIAGRITSTNFKDNLKIPAALVGYVGAAAKLHLMDGYPSGYFHPNADLTHTQEGDLIHHLVTAMSSVSLKITASTSDAAPGQIVILSAEGVTASGGSVSAANVIYSVRGTNASSAMITGNVFSATAAGSYTIQGRSAGATGSVTIKVYGSPAVLKILLPQNVVANGVSSTSVEVEVLDPKGNLVSTSSAEIVLRTDTNAALGLLNSTGQVDAAGTVVSATAVNGIASFPARAGLLAGASTKLTATGAAGTGLLPVTASVTAAAQVATAITLAAASPYIAANGTGGKDVLSATVEDQTGSPMLSGSYAVTFSASGPGNFSQGATTQSVYNGSSGQLASAALNDVQGSPGVVTVRASASGLAFGATMVTAVIAGPPAKLVISAGQTVNADSSATYTLTVEDSHGYPADWSGSVDLSTSDPTGAGRITPGAVITFLSQSARTFSAADTRVGSYTLSASDASKTLTATTSTLTVTPGPLAGLAVSPDASPAAYVLVSGGQWNWTVQLVDDHGNRVTEPGVPVSWLISPASGNRGDVTANGQTEGPPGTSFTVTSTTNAEGIATVAARAVAYAGDGYCAQATASARRSPESCVRMENLIANAPIQVTYKDPASGASVTNFISDGTRYQGYFQLRDQQGAAYEPISGLCVSCTVQGDTVEVTASGQGSVSLAGATVTGGNGAWFIKTDVYGEAYFTVTAETGGEVTLSYRDLNTYDAPLSTSAVSVSSGQTSGNIGFFSGGTEITSSAPLTVPAGGEAEVAVSSLDQGGNPIVAPDPIPVAFTVEGGTGVTRDAPSGLDLPIPFVTIGSGQTGAIFYFVNEAGAQEKVWFSGSPGTIAIASPGTLAATQSGAPYTLTWTITSGGNPVSGLQVGFSAVAANGSAALALSSAGGTTNSLGQVTVTATTPLDWGGGDIDKVILTTQGATPLTSTATLTDAFPSSITSNADGGMTYTAGSMSQMVTFTVRTWAGTPVPAGTEVLITASGGSLDKGAWEVSGTAGALGQPSISLATNAGGEVSAFLTDTSAGDTGRLTASVVGYPGVVDATGLLTIVAGPVAKIISPSVSDLGISDVAAGQSTAIKLMPEDMYGNPVPNSTLEISYSSGGGVPADGPATGLTGPGGSYTLAYAPGTNAADRQTVDVTDGAGAYVFTVQVVPGPPTGLVLQSAKGTLDGSGQISFAAEVVDQYGNVVTWNLNQSDFAVQLSANPDSATTAVSDGNDVVTFTTVQGGYTAPGAGTLTATDPSMGPSTYSVTW